MQLDVFVVCDDTKITKDMGIQGVPDIVIEVLSQSNRRHDMFLKYNLYQYYGVKEYWIIDIEAGVILPYHFNQENNYTLLKSYEITEEIKVKELDNCIICLKDVMQDEK